MTALHVKYRPTKFDAVVGHADVIKSLKRVVKDNRAKTFIFTGPSGVGKTTISRILANEFAGGDATVVNIEEFDAATNSGADAVRAVSNRVLYRAVGHSPIKCIIIDEAHRLSSAAWTVLLKPIEEPPAHVYWMFCTTEAGKIPKTIQTRCLRYDLKPVSEEMIFGMLDDVAKNEKIEIEDDILEAIAENCNGSPRQALVYLEECIYCENPNQARAIMRTAGQTGEIIDLCRFLINPKGGWATAIKLIKNFDNVEAESCRIVVCNYLASTLLSTQDERKAAALLGVLECFKTSYNPSDKMAPLLYSVGLALGLDK